MSGTMSGDEHDFARSLNLDCWRVIIPYLDKPTDIVALADASPLLEAFLDELDLLEGAELCVSQSKFDVKIYHCYDFFRTKLIYFINHFEGHKRNPFVSPACHISDFSYSADVAVNLLYNHGRCVRDIKLTFFQNDRWPLSKLAQVLSYLPNLEMLVVCMNTWSTEIDRCSADFESFLCNYCSPAMFPYCPYLTQLNLSLANHAPLFNSLIRHYGPQLTRLFVDIPYFSYSDLTMDDWNNLASLQSLEIRYDKNLPEEEWQKMYSTLSVAQWPLLTEIHIPFRSHFNAQLNYLQNFRATLETVVFDTDRKKHLDFNESLLEAAAHHDSYPNLVELGIAHPEVYPASESLRKYISRVFPNTKRMFISESYADFNSNLQYGFLEYYFNDFPKLEEIVVATLQGRCINYKRIQKPPSSYACFATLSMSPEKLLDAMRDKLTQWSNIKRLSVDVVNAVHATGYNVERPVLLPACPHLKQLDLTKLAWISDTGHRFVRRNMESVVESLFHTYGAQLTELLTGAFHVVDINSWNTLTNLQILRINMWPDRRRNVCNILQRLTLPKLREISFDKEIPFNNDIIAMLGNFRESLSTLRLSGWCYEGKPWLRLPPDENVQVLPNLRKLVLSRRFHKNEEKTESWRTFSNLIPNMSELHFVKTARFNHRLVANDLIRYVELFRNVNEIQLVHENGRKLEHWRCRRRNDL